jgi:hypothetical protein
MLKKILIAAGLVMTIVLMVLLTSPDNPLLVGAIIILASAIAYILASLFLPLKKAILPPLFVAVLLVLNYIIGFDLLNTILLLCFIIGLSLL